MTEKEKDIIRDKRRFQYSLSEGSVCFIDEKVLTSEEKVLYKDFLNKPATIIKSLDYCHVFGCGYTYIHKLYFENQDFEVPYLTDYVGYVPTELLLDTKHVSFSYSKSMLKDVTKEKLIELGFKVCN